MAKRPALLLLLLLALASAWPCLGAGQHWQVIYPPSTTPGELSLGVTYTLWIPEGPKTLRGVIVHQHGCGKGACEGGATAAHDLHWQALARKWDCALLGPFYHQDDRDACTRWCDPTQGSAQTFLRALSDFAAHSGHPELAQAPWCLWGHSGGGVWASGMQLLYPERIVAVWLRSGSIYMRLGQTNDAPIHIPDAACAVPVMCNPGTKEQGHSQFNRAWTGTLEMFRVLRARNAPIGFAPDPRTSHECGDSRYLAIPFFDACLDLRLPGKRGSGNLRPIDPERGWLAPLLGQSADRASRFRGKRLEAVWLPNERVAQAWIQYVSTGATDDRTPPPRPFNARLQTVSNQVVELSWEAEADLESGLAGFVILRDGRELARLPDKPAGRFGRPLFQSMSYHDTPEKPLPLMHYIDAAPEAGPRRRYDIVAVNSVGLQSRPARAR